MSEEEANSEKSSEKSCPLCGEDNRCGNVAGLPQGECWCNKFEFPGEIFKAIPEEKLNKACICKECVEKAGRP